ncbi:MAG: hypothetical protein QOE90_174 [Thermoplasmata archaeon]|jgi:PKD repeat protein|nr:hypothetical protein [Thermoplasmata archaeon]
MRPITVLVALVLVGAPWIAPASGAATPPPSVEALLDPGLEGSPSQANGFVLAYAGAQTSPLARGGTQAVDLAKGGAAPQPSLALGEVIAFPAAPPVVASLVALRYQFEVPTLPQPISLQEVLQLDDGTCLATAPHALARQTTYAAWSVDLAAPLQACDGSGPATMPAGAHLVSFAIQTLVASPGAWPQGAPVLVDDLSVAVAAIRVSPDACGGSAYATVADALACAPAGATVLLAPRTYAGFDITSGVTVCATAPGGETCQDRQDVVVDGPASRLATVRLLAPDATLRGLVVQNPNLTATGADVTASLVQVAGDRDVVQGATLRNLGAQAASLGRRAADVGFEITGADVRLEGNRINLAAATTPLRAIDVAAPDAWIHGNLVTVPANSSTAPLDAIAVRVVADGANVSGNVLQSSSFSAKAPLGILLVGQGFALSNNGLTGFERGLDMTLTGPASSTADVFTATLPIAVRGGSPTLWNDYVVGSGTTTAVTLDDITNATFGHNHLRGATTLALGPGVHGLALDARHNDWGVYSRAAILASIADAGSGNGVDARCYLDSIPTREVCPPTPSFTIANSTWGRPIAFADASQGNGRDLAAWSWSFSDGGSATGATASHVFAAPGAYQATLAVTDADGWTSTLTRDVPVLDAAPVLLPLADQVVAEDHDLAFRVGASDPDQDNVTFAMAPLPAGATFDNATGAFRWRPGFAQEGTYGPIDVSVTDGWRTDSQAITITVGHSNAPPGMAIEGNLSGREGQPLSFLVRGSDVDGDPVSLFSTVLPVGASFVDFGNGTARLAWTPDFTQAGDYDITLQASDAQNLTESTITLHVVNVDRAPVFASIPTAYGIEGQPLQIQVSATDPDADPVSFSARGLPAGATFDAAHQVLRWVPGYLQAGAYNVTFLANDGTLSASAVGRLVVADADRAPILQPIPDVSAVAGDTVRVALHASDPDKDALRFSVPGAPAGLAFQGATLVWATSAAQAGAYALDVVVSDGNLTADAALNVTLGANAPPSAAIAVPAAAEAGVPVLLSAYGSHDADGSDAKLQYAWDFDPADGFQAQATGMNVSWRASAVGPIVVTVRVTDQAGLVAYANATMLVDDHLNVGVIASVASSGVATAIVSLRDDPFGPLTFHGVTVNVTWAPAPGLSRIVLHTVSATTRGDGVAVAPLPQDLPTGDLPGTHYVEASATLPGSYGADTEVAGAETSYSPVILA